MRPSVVPLDHRASQNSGCVLTLPLCLSWSHALATHECRALSKALRGSLQVALGSHFHGSYFLERGVDNEQQARDLQVPVGAIKKIKWAGCGCQVGGGMWPALGWSDKAATQEVI